MASDVRIWTGTAWESIKGPKGDPGPTEVSAEVGNSTRLGSDGKIYTPTPVIPIGSTTVRGTVQLADAAAVTAGTAARVVDAAQLKAVRDTVPTPADAAGVALAVAGAIGTSPQFAREDHTHPRPSLAELGAATVATSGSYNDLSNRPTIPAAYTLPVATAAVLGGVKQGAGVAIAADGTLSVSGGSGPAAASTPPVNLAATASVGTSTAYARADHVHARPTLAELGAAPTATPTFTGQVLAPAGDVTAPGYSFAADTNTGLYLSGPDSLAMSVGGVARMAFSGDSATFFVNGLFAQSAVAFCPSFTLTNTTNDQNQVYVNLFKKPPNAMVLPCNLGTIQFGGSSIDGTVRTGSMISSVCDLQQASTITAYTSFLTVGLTGLAERLRLGSDGNATFSGNIVAQGTANTFAQASINSTALGPLQIVNIGTTGTYNIVATDAGKVLLNSHTVADSTINIPANATVPIPIGTVIEILDATNRLTWLQAAAGVTVNFNSTTGSDSGVLGGGVAARCRLRGILTSARIVKVGTNLWYVFGDILAS
jgi:hypothetical protein